MICVLPCGNDRPASQFPAVTYALIAMNLIVYIWSRYQPDIAIYGLIASRPFIGNIPTSMFVHSDALHLGWNMFFLYMFGPNVEEALGRIRYALFYFGSGFAAALLHVVVALQFTPDTASFPMIGASGAIAGILGVYAVRYYKTSLRIWFFFFSVYIPAWVALGVWFVQQLYGGIMCILFPYPGGIAYWSHIGGMVFGMLLAYILRMGREGTKEFLMTGAKNSMENGTTWGATECLLSLLKHDPDNADVHRELGRTYATQTNPDQALSHYRKSVEFFLRADRLENASEAFAQMRQYYPTAHVNMKSEFRLARYLADAGNHEVAIPILENIIRLHPESPEAETAVVKIGDIYLNNLDEPQTAQVWYDCFLREYPHSSYRAMVEKSLSRISGNG